MSIQRLNRDFGLGHGIGIRVPIYLEDEEGCENCNEDDEERKDVDIIGSSVRR